MIFLMHTSRLVPLRRALNTTPWPSPIKPIFSYLFTQRHSVYMQYGLRGRQGEWGCGWSGGCTGPRPPPSAPLPHGYASCMSTSLVHVHLLLLLCFMFICHVCGGPGSIPNSKREGGPKYIWYFISSWGATVYQAPPLPTGFFSCTSTQRRPASTSYALSGWAARGVWWGRAAPLSMT